MIFNWTMIAFVFALTLPGIFIAIPRIISCLLPDNTEQTKRRFSIIAIVQTLVMVLLMSIAGAVLSSRIGFNNTLLESIIHAKVNFADFQAILLPAFGNALGCLIGFLVLYYGVACRILEPQSIEGMAKLRSCLGLAGLTLYGGVVEEVIARWGLMSVCVYFISLFYNSQPALMWASIAFSGVAYAFGQVPIYLAVGCQAGRRFFYTFLLLSLWQSLFFGYLFWNFGLICSIVSHMLFFLGWAAIKPGNKM